MWQLDPWTLQVEQAVERRPETASKYDYHNGNDHFAYQMVFVFIENQRRVKKDQYRGNVHDVEAGILKNVFAWKISVFLQKKKSKKILKIE